MMLDLYHMFTLMRVLLLLCGGFEVDIGQLTDHIQTPFFFLVL